MMISVKRALLVLIASVAHVSLCFPGPRRERASLPIPSWIPCRQRRSPSRALRPNTPRPTRLGNNEEGMQFLYKRPGMFLLEGKPGVVQPQITVTIAEGRVKGWIPGRDVVMNMEGQSAIPPAILLSLQPGMITEFSDKIALKIPEFTGENYVLEATVKPNPVIDSTKYAGITLYVSKKDSILKQDRRPGRPGQQISLHRQELLQG